MKNDKNNTENSRAEEVLDTAICSPSFLKARVESSAELYREGKVTRSECLRVELDHAHGENTGDLVLEDNDDHKFMMDGKGEDHDEYRRREEKSPYKLATPQS